MCITPPLTSFLWSVPPLRKTCGIYLDGCVSPTLFSVWMSFVYQSSKVYSTKATPLVTLCFWIMCTCVSGINPSLWDKEDVAHWLYWAQKEYSLRRPEKGRFEMNGRALCLLTKEDFRRRCPSSGRDKCVCVCVCIFFCAWAFICTPYFLQVMFCMRSYSV